MTARYGTRKMVRTLAVSLAFAAAGAGAASAGLLGIDGSYQLWDINTANGTPTNPRFTGDKINTIAMTQTGTLYAVSQGFPTDVPPGGGLYTLNVANGFPTFIATLDTFIVTEGDIAWDPVGNQLYAVDGPGMLFRINTSNGTTTIVGDIGTNLDLSAMAFDASGTLWVVDCFGPTLLKVNKANAAILQTIPLDPVNQEVGGLAFDPGNGTLYYAGGYSSSKLYTLNTTNGNALTIGTIAVSMGTWGLTFEPVATPVEPTTWGRIKSRFE